MGWDIRAKSHLCYRIIIRSGLLLRYSLDHIDYCEKLKEKDFKNFDKQITGIFFQFFDKKFGSAAL